MKAGYIDKRYYAYFVREDEAEEIAESLAMTIRAMHRMEWSILNELQ